MAKKSFKKLLLSQREDSLVKVEEFCYALSGAIPQTLSMILFAEEGFRGLTITVGNRGGYLAIGKIYDRMGMPAVLYANGDTPVEALMQLEERMDWNNFKDDLRAEDYQKPSPVSSPK